MVNYKMRAVIKLVKMQQPITLVAVTEKYFAIAKKERKICKEITTFFVHTEK